MSKLTAIIVDDEQEIRTSVSQFLGLSDIHTVEVESAERAMPAISRDLDAVIITDIRMPGMDGRAFLSAIMAVDSTIPVIMMTGHGDVQMAVECLQAGAYDFIEKPFDPERLIEQVRRAGKARELTLDNRALRRELADHDRIDRLFIGSTPAVEALREMILDYADSDDHLLIEGEIGTGRSLVARAVHACSMRQKQPFITLYCNALEDEVLEERLFSEDNPRAIFHSPQNLTLCLEDIDALSPRLQNRLIQYLAPEEGDVPKVRVIATRTLNNSEQTGTISEDLYFRIAGKKISVPPLRERGGDIITLFDRYLEQFTLDYGSERPELTADQSAKLMTADWPGNVRQLIKFAEKIALLSSRQDIDRLFEDELQSNANFKIPASRPLKAQVEAFEKVLISESLRRHNGQIALVMEELSLPRRTLNEKMARYALNRSDFVS